MNQITAARKDIPGIDIFKFVMAFAVVLIHIPPVFGEAVGRYPAAVEWFIRMAVPFFFIVSGYFADRIIDSPEKLRGRGFKLLRIWAVWMIIYFPMQLYHGFPNPRSVAVYIANIFITGAEAYAWPLWFLYAQIVFFLIESMLVGRPRLRAAVHAFYVAAMLAVSFLNLHRDIAPWMLTYTPVSIIGGCGFLLGGYYLKKFAARTEKVPAAYAVSAGGLSILLFCLGLPLWELSGGIAVVIIALAVKCNPRPVYLIIRHESIWIYYLHMYVLMLLSRVIFTGGTSMTVAIICAFTLSFAIAWLLSHLQKRCAPLAFLVS